MTSNKWFSSRILSWYDSNNRDLPWRGSQNPYLVWLSEIILQQTRVEQGISYFKRFSSKYPRVADLANATQEEVLKDWEGLGYYSRARNLHFTAKYVTNELNGVFPSSYDQLIGLKGIGPYTAAAISSICSAEPVAVVDGNVYRVLSRVFGIRTPIDSGAGKKEFQLLANTLLDTSCPGDFNQAVMEFGAVHCTPKSYDCPSCIFSAQCSAHSNDVVGTLPIKTGKVKVRDRFFEFFLIGEGDDFFIEQRKGKDIWEGLFQFPLLETKEQRAVVALTKEAQEKFGIATKPDLIQDSTKHILSHQRIHARLWHFRSAADEQASKDWIRVKSHKLSNYAFPRLLTRWLETCDFTDIIE